MSDSAHRRSSFVVDHSMRGPNGGDDAAAEGTEGNWNRTLHFFAMKVRLVQPMRGGASHY